MSNLILGLVISGIVFGTLGALALCRAAAMERPRRTIKVGGIKPFESRSINNRLALGLLAQESNKNKRRN
jgi:hypothetical protein